mmetsp:Transcript_23942/g.33606  ORF Transcript_23942/g.33606 Transcript_23942/m.33606 type:complete len:447 (-) Transcript_23942:2685-4025(-)
MTRSTAIHVPLFGTLVLCSLLSEIDCFLPAQPLLGWTGRNRMILHAKATKKKKSKKGPSSSTAGGFGRKEEPKVAKEEDDYAAFPALEPQVSQTLIPNDEAEESEAGELSPEMYDRIAQIYGFRDFNYDSKPSGDDEGESMSFEDLLSASSTEDEKKSPSSEFSDLLKPSGGSGDFADLLAGATGESVSEVVSDVKVASPELPLSNLPPFSKFRVLHVDPMILAIDDFFTPEECDKYIAMSEKPPKTKEAARDAPLQSRSKTVGKDALAKAQRTSTTWFHHFKQLPELMAKGSRLLGLDGIDNWEEPQTVRYRRKEKFTWHLDALAPSEDLSNLGGQRTATLLVYLTDLTEEEGGATMFRDLGVEGPLKVRPKKGSACLFFPAAGGVPNCPFDIRTLHCGEAVAEDSEADKWIAQMWLRQTPYKATAPPGNSHADASEAISAYCSA